MGLTGENRCWGKGVGFGEADGGPGDRGGLGDGIEGTYFEPFFEIVGSSFGLGGEVPVLVSAASRFQWEAEDL